MTATESLIRNQASVTLTSAVLTQLYNQSEPFYREICRRFSLKDKRDPVVKRFLDACDRDEIPRDVIDSEMWDIIPNRVMGGGNKAVQLTTARALFEARGAFGSAADGPIKRKYALSLTDDPEFVNEIVPEIPTVSQTMTVAQGAFAVLMTRVPYVAPPGINEVEYIETLLAMLGEGMKPLQSLQEQPQAIPVIGVQITGLFNVTQHIEGHIQILAQDASEKERVRGFQDLANQAMQELKAYAQRLSEMEQAQAQGDGAAAIDAETQAKLRAMQTIAEGKVQIAQQTAAVKLQHKDIAFQNEQERKDAGTVSEMRRKQALTHADVAATDLRTRAELIHGAARAQQDQMQTAGEAAHDRFQAESDHQQEQRHAEEAHAREMEHAEAKREAEAKAAKTKKPAKK